MDKNKYPDFFQPQVDRLLQCGYPKALGLSDTAFIEKYLESVLVKGSFAQELVRHRYGPLQKEQQPPILIVMPNCVLPVSEQISLVEFGGQKGRSLIYSEHLENSPRYKTKKAEWLEPLSAYLITGISEGGHFVGHYSEERRLEVMGASLPMTVAEGIALLLQYPRSLYKYPFALIGSIFGLVTGNSGTVPVLKRDQETGAPLLARQSHISLWPYATPTCADRIL